jgi:MOSC domain-containing protein YiiM
MLRIRHLYLSPGHNYFGHHGREPSTHPMLEVPSVHCLAGRGIEGDRFLDYKDQYKGQVTFFAWEVFEELRAALGLADVTPAGLRRNILLEGVDLNHWIGEEFEVQGLRFKGTQECAPCYWMDRAYAPGAEEFLKGRGGLRAQILTGGTLSAQ